MVRRSEPSLDIMGEALFLFWIFFIKLSDTVDEAWAGAKGHETISSGTLFFAHLRLGTCRGQCSKSVVASSLAMHKGMEFHDSWNVL